MKSGSYNIITWINSNNIIRAQCLQGQFNDITNACTILSSMNFIYIIREELSCESFSQEKVYREMNLIAGF